MEIPNSGTFIDNALLQDLYLSNMIPKKLHYIWLSNDPMPLLPRICIDSWKRHCPDFEIVHWDMEKCRHIIESVPFVREAVEHSKWAFASDYIRLYAVYQEGGIYLDSDVYMYQSNDTVWVTNLYGFGWRNNYMLLDADRVMTFPGQTIRDISNANNPGGDGVWYNTTLDAEENPVMGNTGSVSKDEITWGLMVPSDGDGLWWGYDENVLYFTDGTKFVIPSGPEPTLRGDVNEDGGVNIADVTDLIDMLLNGTAAGVANADCNGDGEVNIADVAALIDYLLAGIWA